MIVGVVILGVEYFDLYMVNYGYGWFFFFYRGYYWVEYGGNIDGFFVNICFFLSDSVGIVVLVN